MRWGCRDFVASWVLILAVRAVLSFSPLENLDLDGTPLSVLVAVAVGLGVGVFVMRRREKRYWAEYLVTRGDCEASGTSTGTEPPLVLEPPLFVTPDYREQGSGENARLLAMVQAKWPEIVEELSHHPPTRPVIMAAKPVAVQGNVVILGFPPGTEILRDVAERRASVVLQPALARALGKPVAIECQIRAES